MLVSLFGTFIGKVSKFVDACNSLVGWTAVEGTVVVSNDSFVGNSFAPGASGWSYATISRGTPAFNDFEIIANVTLPNLTSNGQIGGALIHLLDNSNKRVAEFGITDAWAAVKSSEIWGGVYQTDGTTYTNIYDSNEVTTYNNWTGDIKLTRIGNTFTLYIAGVQKGSLTFSRPEAVSKIEASLRIMDGYTTCAASINNIQINPL